VNVEDRDVWWGIIRHRAFLTRNLLMVVASGQVKKMLGASIQETSHPPARIGGDAADSTAPIGGNDKSLARARRRIGPFT